MRSHVRTSLDRGLHRVAGTAVGSALAWIFITHIGTTTLRCSLALAVFGFLCALLVLAHKRSYAWLFTGITFAMVLTSGAFNPTAVARFAFSRVAEVAIGTSACVVVSALSTYLIRRSAPRRMASATPPFYPHGTNRSGFFKIHLAGQAAVALAVIPFFWRWIGVESAQQATTTIFAVMAVPAINATISSGPTSVKLVLRLAGCFAGGLLASAALVLSHGLPELMTLALCAGILCGRHLENGPHRFAYGGTQFVLAFLTVLVPDRYDTTDIGPGLDRVGGILVGLLLLEPVRLAFASIPRYLSRGMSENTRKVNEKDR
jgi:uncharacterized membrane protein YccC